MTKMTIPAIGEIRNELIAVASRPGVGKTMYLMYASETLASAGIPGVFFTLEMRGPLFAYRALSHPREYRAAKELPIIVEDSLTSVESIAARLRNLTREGRARWAMIDYLGLVRGDGDVISNLAELRKELDIPILFSLELPRGPIDEKPSILDSRDAGSLMKFCDTAIVLSECDAPDFSRTWRDIELTETTCATGLALTSRAQMNPSTQEFRDPA